MCTAATYKTKDFYMGRTLDYEFSYGEQITITPRKYPFAFRHDGMPDTHYAIIGMAHVAGGYPLYYDAVNEKGLGMAGLNFVGNAVYAEVQDGKHNIAQFEFIPWILSRCADLKEAKETLADMNLVGTPFSEQFPTAQLHWIIADTTGAVVVESVRDGLKVYDNPVGVLTNNPPFEMQIFNLNNYSASFGKTTGESSLQRKLCCRLTAGEWERSECRAICHPCPGLYVWRIQECTAVSGKGEEDSVGQFFHILGSVEQQRGCCEVTDGKYEITIYTSCMNASRGIYYYTTYQNHQITAVDMHREDLDAEELICYPMKDEETFVYQN